MDEPQASPRKILSLPDAPAAPADVRTETAVVAEAPDHWPADVRAEFAQATPLWKEFMVARTKGLESGYTKRNQAMAVERKSLDEYRARWRVYAARVSEVRGEPVEIEAVIERLIEFVVAVESSPPQLRPSVILDMAGAAYGLPPVAFAATIEAAQQEAGQAQVAQQEQQRSEAQAEAAVLAFADALDASGKPRHPYFAEVEVEMRDLARVEVDKGLQPDLGDLYSAACRLNPVVSAKVSEAERRQAATQRDADERERISRAKAANGSITGAGGGHDPVGGSVAEILDRAVPDTGW